MKHLDLFSGIGGFALAARWAQIETIAFCEKDEFCRKVLFKHWPDIIIYDDIKKMDFTAQVDLLTAGFPCQPFSVAGKKKGFSDDRYLWPDTLRIIKQSKPNWVILENVPGIVPCLDPILEDLERENYDWRAYLIPASAIGAPHKRERLWVIANSHSERCYNRSDYREKRSFQDDWQWHFETVQSEWTQFIPQSWKAFNAQDWIISNSHSITSEQTNTRTIAEQKEWETRTGYSGQYRGASFQFNWEKDQPPIPGVDDGIPHGLDRNKSLGNAIVPQIAYIFMNIIKGINDEQRTYME